MQRNAVAVVALAGSCAVLYILYRFKYLSKKSNCIAAVERTMGKSNQIKLNEGKENMYGMVAASNTSMKSDKTNIKKSVKKSKNKKYEDNHDAPMVCQINLEINNSGNELSESLTSRSNLDTSQENCDHMENIKNDSNSQLPQFIKYKEMNGLYELNNYNDCNAISYVANNNNDPSLLRNEFQNSMTGQGEQTYRRENVNSEKIIGSNCVAHLNLNIENVEEGCTANRKVGNGFWSVDSQSEIAVLKGANLEFENSIVEKRKLNNEPKRLEADKSAISLQSKQHKNNDSDDQFNASSNKNLESVESIANGNLSYENSHPDKSNNCDNSSSNDEKIESSISTGPSVKPKTIKSKRRKNRSSIDKSDAEENSNLSSSPTSSFDSTCSESNAFPVEENVLGTEQISTTSDPCVETKVEAIADSATVDATVDATADSATVNATTNLEYAYQAFLIYVAKSKMEEFIDYQFEIPQLLVGRLIGKGGNFIKKLKSETNCDVVVRNGDGNSELQVCSIRGYKSAVFDTLRRIRAHFPLDDPQFSHLTLVALYPIPESRTPQFLKPSYLTSGCTFIVKFCSFNTSGEIWLQQPLQFTYTLYKGLSVAMNTYYVHEKAAPSFDLPILERSVGVCMLENQQWVRCMVLNHTSTDAEVQLIDSGEVISVPLENMKKLLFPDFAVVDVQATAALFNDLLPIEGNEYTEEARLFLNEMLTNKSLVATIDAYTTESKPCISLYIHDKENKRFISVNEELIKFGFAKKEDFRKNAISKKLH